MKKGFDRIIIVISVLLLVLVAGLSVFLNEGNTFSELKTNVLTGAAVTKLAESNNGIKTTLANIGVQASTTNCWNTANSASQSACESNNDCTWKSTAGGSWCEQKSCWNFYDSVSCGESNTSASTNYINKSCNWQAGTTTGWCKEIDCWSFDGNQTGCLNSGSSGLNCSWSDTYNAATYDYPCQGPPEKNCWGQTTSGACTNITGCTWGSCERQSCSDQTTSSACTATKGYNNQDCKWNAQYSYCYESGCWDNTNKSACETASCKWEGGSCYEQYCSNFGYKNESYCVNNTAGLNCNYNDPWCEEASCSSQNTALGCTNTNSSSGKSCFWETYTGGWCEEIGCWQWDGWKTGGNESNCLANSSFYGLGCTWQDDPKGVSGVDGWCYEDISSNDCTTITKERDCIDTYYCFWNNTGSTCQEPTNDISTSFVAWYPGCNIFDYQGQSACDNVTGCTWDGTACQNNATLSNTDPAIGGLRCSYINNSNMCSKMTMLPSCCEWQAGSCTENKLTTKCWDQMEEYPEGASYCEDYNSYTDQTLCNKIAGDPFYMPCRWDNKTTSDAGDDRCVFKQDQMFEAGKENLVYLDSEKVCKSAGGKWVVDMYASSTDSTTAVALPMGHCEEDFGGKRNCNSDCYACDYKSDGINHSSSSAAESNCYSSLLGMCGFTTDTSAPNGYGYCKPKTEFAKGIAKNCDDDCGSCTYMGSPTSAEAASRPSTFCKNSKVTGGCKWMSDLDYPTDESKGRCTKKAEKTCEDKCDLCTTESHCTNKGKKQGNTTQDTQCSWSDVTNTCSLTQGGSQMEICWDGVDNNNNGKMDCADSQCFSDSFCGGGFMAGFGGLDCFGPDTQTDCQTAGCVWITENWGSWCDMPGANCWSNDGDEAACGLDGNCTWHSGFGGFCEENWSQMGSTTEGCMSYARVDCLANINNNCTWVQDSYYEESGGDTGWCQQWNNYDWSTGGSYVDCNAYSTSATCTTAGIQDGNNIYPCAWMTAGGGGGSNYGEEYGGGWCDHMKYACDQFSSLDSCQNQTVVNASADYNHSDFCIWKTDEWGSYCEGKTMSGTSSTESCWNQANSGACASKGCVWQTGFCDPVGFGSDMGFGGTAGSVGAGSDFTPMGGMGSSCFLYNGNQTGCAASQGCGWFAEQSGFCDVNKEANCPQYSYNSEVCDAQPRCIYYPQQQFCGDKAFACSTNQSYNNGLDDPNVPGTIDAQECESNSLCYWADWNSCEPVSFNASVNSESICNGDYNVTNGTDGVNVSAFVWISGWCNPGMTSQFFKEMEGGAPIPLGTDTQGDVSSPEVDIVDYGLKDMGSSFGFGIRVDNLINASMCNGIKLSGGITGAGYNTTKFYWYLDTDGTSTGGCSTQDSNALAGFEFYLKNTWVWSSSSGSNVETTEAYKCEDGSWKKTGIPLTTFKQKSCIEIGGGMIAVQKAELERFPTLYTTGGDMRVYVATANANGNVTNPTDTLSIANVGYASPGSIDQDLDSLDLYGFKNASKKVGEGSSKGYITYSDVDCWTATGCADYQCKGHPYCVTNSLGVEAVSFIDTRVPKVTGIIKEAYPDSVVLKFFTDKPSNGSLDFYNTDNTCATLNTTIDDIGINNSNVNEYRLWHFIEIYNETNNGKHLATGTTYYYKLNFCDNESKCGVSKCSPLVTEDSESDCAFCKFVTKIEAPAGWNVSYDLDQDQIYEFDQNAFSASVGMLTNYTNGRRANIKLATSDNSSWIEFLDTKLTKTGVGSSNVRKFTDTTDIASSTTTDVSGNTVGYVGMIEDARDKIINNLFPEICLIKFPQGNNGCTALWHCDSTGANCIDRTTEATLNETGGDYCIWEIPYCEFSRWGGGDTGSSSSSSSSSSSGGGGSSSSSVVATTTETPVVETTPIAETKKVAEIPVEKATETSQKAATQTPTPAVKQQKQALAGQAWGQFGDVLTDLSWLWVTVVIVIAGVVAFFYLRKKQ